MNAVLKNFKTIPCPAGDKCSQSDCQWKHPWEKPWDKGPVSERDSGGGSDSSGPRKRLKTDRGHKTTAALDQTKKITTAVPSSSSASSSASPSADPVSPSATTLLPVLSREDASQVTHNRAVSKDSLVSASAKAPIHLHSPSSTSTPTPTPTPSSNMTGSLPAPVTKAKQNQSMTKRASRKPEALNPRHLKSSPATHEFRFKVLKMLHEQFVRLNTELKKNSDGNGDLVLSDQELIWRALDEEEKTALDKPAIYSNVIKNRIMVLKRLNLSKWREERLAEMKAIAAARSAATADATAQSILGAPKIIDTGLTPSQEVQFLGRLLTPIDDLSRFNYVPSVPTEDDIREARLAEESSQGWEVCDRCATRFQVFPGRNEHGLLASGGQCVFHPGKQYFPERQLGDKSRVQKRWRCCKEAIGDSAGCTKTPHHVFKISHAKRLAAVLPFIETPPNPLAPTDRAVCFDCEMGYTVKGLELIRLTATSWPDGAELLDVLVYPIGEILDLNSRYSGIFPEDFANAVPFSTNDAESEKKPSHPEHAKLQGSSSGGDGGKFKKPMRIVPSISAARDLLFSLISPETPLLGHGLENDLNAIRIVHPAVVDTVLLYPHKRGLPLRHGLKALMETLLNRAIQVEPTDGSQALGHDSAEDARAAGELVRLKVQKEWSRLKGLGWGLVDGAFMPPSGVKEEKVPGSLTEEFLEKPAVARTRKA